MNKHFLLHWKILPPPACRAMPEGIITFAPAFTHPKLPIEALTLLPKTACSQGLLADIAENPELALNRIVGLFITDPFLNLSRIAKDFGRRNVTWVANLPTIAQHDEEFRSLVGDVGFGVKNEMAALAQLSKAGMRTLGAISDPSDALIVAAARPDAVFILPDFACLTKGFTSLATRLNLLEAMCEALSKEGYDGPVFGLFEASETTGRTMTLPAGAGAILRPVIMPL